MLRVSLVHVELSSVLLIFSIRGMGRRRFTSRRTRRNGKESPLIKIKMTIRSRRRAKGRRGKGRSNNRKKMENKRKNKRVEQDDYE